MRKVILFIALSMTFLSTMSLAQQKPDDDDDKGKKATEYVLK